MLQDFHWTEMAIKNHKKGKIQEMDLCKARKYYSSLRTARAIDRKRVVLYEGVVLSVGGMVLSKREGLLSIT